MFRPRWRASEQGQFPRQAAILRRRMGGEMGYLCGVEPLLFACLRACVQPLATDAHFAVECRLKIKSQGDFETRPSPPLPEPPSLSSPLRADFGNCRPTVSIHYYSSFKIVPIDPLLAYQNLFSDGLDSIPQNSISNSLRPSGQPAQKNFFRQQPTGQWKRRGNAATPSTRKI